MTDLRTRTFVAFVASWCAGYLVIAIAWIAVPELRELFTEHDAVAPIARR